jgi:hypothetical protein
MRQPRLTTTCTSSDLLAGVAGEGARSAEVTLELDEVDLGYSGRRFNWIYRNDNGGSLNS